MANVLAELINVSFSGPSAARTYTLPDANCTLLTTNAAVTVLQGGTGLTSATAYAVLCGGTTSTAAFQSIAGVGSAGQVLTSNGAGALPTFQNASGAAMTVSGAGFANLPAGPAISTAVATSSSGNTYGTYVEFRGATGNAIYITGISITIPGSGSINASYIQVAIGTGAAASETQVSELKYEGNIQAIYQAFEDNFEAWIPVAANTRIAVKTASDTNRSSANVPTITLRVIDQADVS